ncbi:MAG: hypothetical protein ACO1OC_13330 [Tuberibacillus sp.]
MQKAIQWLFKWKEHDLVELFTLFFGLLIISIIFHFFVSRHGELAWLPVMIIIGFAIFIAVRLIVKFLLGSRNRVISGGYLFVALLLVALIQTFWL